MSTKTVTTHDFAHGRFTLCGPCYRFANDGRMSAMVGGSVYLGVSHGAHRGTCGTCETRAALRAEERAARKVETAPAFAIVTMGRINTSASTTTRRSFYRSLDAAIKDARGLYGPSTVRVIECPTVGAAKAADISDAYPVAFTR